MSQAMPYMFAADESEVREAIGQEGGFDSFALVFADKASPGTLVRWTVRKNRKAAVSALDDGFARLVEGAKPVVVTLPAVRLPIEQLREVIAAENRSELAIAVRVVPGLELVDVMRGDFSTVTVPFSVFPPNAVEAPDFSKPAVGDWGHSVVFGDYEASMHGILMEGDPAYGRAYRKARREADSSFGASVRRLREAAGLKQDQIPGVTRRTMIRIESGEVKKVRLKTLELVATALGVPVDELSGV